MPQTPGEKALQELINWAGREEIELDELRTSETDRPIDRRTVE
ncbi:hypothetical protein [Streptomyces sp. NPDC051577]